MFDELEVIDADTVAVTHELDRFQCPVANVDAPSETGDGHRRSSLVGR
jgi:hypothetical protein